MPDCIAADELLDQLLTAEILHGDKGYDSDAVPRNFLAVICLAATLCYWLGVWALSSKTGKAAVSISLTGSVNAEGRGSQRYFKE